MERIKIIIDNEEIACKVIARHNDGSLRLEIACSCNGLYNGTEQKTITPEYAIIHHSQMTDCNLYFIAKDEKTLIDNEKTINEFMASDFDNAEKIFNKLGITYAHEEYDEIPNNLIIVKKYSYRF